MLLKFINRCNPQVLQSPGLRLSFYVYTMQPEIPSKALWKICTFLRLNPKQVGGRGKSNIGAPGHLWLRMGLL